VIPQANIIAWRSTAPWQDDAMVEQDLVLTRALVELFNEPKLAGKIALRGGTSLHKLFLQPAYRYSEDIDLVQTESGPIGPLLDAIRDNLDSWLGKPIRDKSEGNITLIYRFQSEIPPVRPLRLKVEINSREHFTLLGLHREKLIVVNPWFTSQAEIVTFLVNELLGTKLRALYQRRKGRDLFDLWLCLEQKLVEPDQAILCFVEYMKRGGHKVTRAQFEQNLHEKKDDPAFMDDIGPLLSPRISYDSAEALSLVKQAFIVLLPGDAWRGPGMKTP
jgi:predicted nucleotidyltransferase component of viral defense system